MNIEIMVLLFMLLKDNKLVIESVNNTLQFWLYNFECYFQDFSDFVFDWHVREGKQSKLLGQSYSSKRQEKLGKFLAGHSTISWIHDIQTEKFMSAADTLQNLAENEVKNVAKKKVSFLLDIKNKIFKVQFC